MRAELPDLKGLSAFSIGCESGADAQWLYEHGACQVFGVDISIELVKLAAVKYPNIGFQVMGMALPWTSR